MKAPTIHPLFYGVIILRALMCGAQNNSYNVPSLLASTPDPRTPEENVATGAMSPRPSSQAATTPLPSAVRSTSKPNPLPDLTPSSVATPVGVLDTRNCIPLMMLTGGLILICLILLLSTSMLTCKVCQMSKRIRMLGSDFAKQMESNGKYKSNLETEAKETSMLLTDLNETQKEVDRSGPKEEDVKVRENGEKGEGKQEAEEAAKSEEAADVTPVDDSSCLTQQKPGDANASVAASPDGTEKQKDVV
ncbi:uncharacterized protein LOC109508945 [Hippocampus comes]|uniref:uncharacterized protein LOC109508945 n=1 Tax=Hippocampus comes TaxID=109280 RepID=UPI00094EFFC7|nr:PREDICTED: uncharacterized protein LOC109508945 [Hippocampus comes]XP_019714426.1 PREDICTED: uncharacterized protein LOC109508945 [Hippocampus comes]